MKSIHIAIFTIPRPVHVHPLLSLVATLPRRGYRVTFVTSKTYSQRVLDLGAEPILCPALRILQYDAAANGTPPEGGVAFDFLSLADQTLEMVTRFYTANVPDLILYDTPSFAGRILATKLDVPAILITPCLEMTRASLERQVESDRFRRSLLSFNDRADRWFETHGIKASDALFHRERLNIYLYLREYQLPEDVADGCSYYAGRCAAEQPYSNPWRKRASDERPTALVSTSTTYSQGASYYRNCAEALTGLGWNVVLALGANNDPTQFMPLPPFCEIAERGPLVSIMPQASLLVCLGGPVTTMEALYHGLPLVLLSHGVDDAELYADRAVHLGCGLHLRGVNVGVDEIRAAVSQVWDNASMRTRVNALQSLVKNSPGAEETANRIEAFLD